MRKVLTMALGFALLASVSAMGQITITQTKSYSGNPGFQAPLSFNRFDASLGHLTSVQIITNMNTTGGFLTVDNDGVNPANATVRLGATGRLVSNDVMLLDNSASAIAGDLSVFTGNTFNLASDNGDGTGNVDPTAPDGATHSGGNDATNDNGFVGDAFREFPGKSYAGNGTYTITMDATALIDFGGLGGVEGSFGPPLIAGDVTVIYTYTPYSADLSITKNISNSTPDVGDNIVYTLVVENNGPDDATGVVVNDLLPASMDFVSASGDGSYNSSTGVWTIGSLANSASATLEITATVNGTGSIVNTATVTGDVDDPTPGNNTDTASSNTPAQIDLELSKTANTSTPDYWGNVIFTLRVTNTSPYDDATNVTVEDVLPAGLSYVTHSGGTYDSGTGIWNVGTVGANNGSRTLTITARVEQIGSIVNSAEVATATEPDIDSTPGVGSGEDDDDSVTLTVAPAADLSLTKTVNEANRNLGEQVVYTLTVSNAGPSNANGVTVEDVLPAGVSYVSSTGDGTYNSGTGLWTIGGLTNGGSASIQITATVTGTGSIVNTAQVETSDQHDPDSTPGGGSGEDDDDSDSFSVPSQVDLELNKSVSNSTPDLGQNVIFTLTVSNTSTYDNATGVTVEDILPAGLNYVSQVGDGTYNSSTGIWTVGTVNANGGSRSIQITARVTSTGTIENFAQVETCNEYDVDSTPGDGDQGDDDDDKVTLTVANAADLRLVKTASKNNPQLNEQFTYTLTLNNDGPDTGNNIVVTDNLPAGVTYVSSTGDGSYNSGTGAWSIAALASGASASLSITVQAAQTGSITNYASVTAVDEYDPDSTPGNGPGEDDDDSVQVNVPRIVDLSLTKNVSNTSPNYHNNVVYTITVNNAGPDNASGVTVRDLLPTGLSYVSDNSGGNYASGTGIWTVGTVNAGGSASIQITARVDGTGFITNRAQVWACDDQDVDSTPGNDAAFEDDDDSIQIDVPEAADLSLVKTVDNASPNLGSQVVFTITVSNDGPDEASPVDVEDVLPAGLSYVGHTVSIGSYSNGEWHIDGIPSGSSAVMTLTAQVNQTGTHVNAAEVTASSQYDPDSTPGSGSNEDDDDTASVTVPLAADVRLVKTVNNATPAFGSNVVYTVTVTNDGPDGVTGLEVTDLLPVSMTYVSHNTGAYTASTGLWDVGSLASGASSSMEITARVNGTGVISNIAQVSAMDQYDTDSTPGNGVASEDDQDNADIIVAPAVDLSLDKSASPMNPGNGENVTFTLTVTNTSPHDDATGVVVRDALVPGLSFISASGTGSYDAGTGLWTVGTVSKGGGSASIDLVARVDASGSMPNFAEVWACNEWDMDSTPGNGNQGEDDEDAVTLGVLEVADLSLNKSVDNSTPSLTDTVTYTLTVSNAGPDAASNIEVTDVLPSSMVYISHSNGNYDNGSGRWTISALAVGASTELTVRARVNGTGGIVNSAQVTGVDQRDPDSTPGNDVASEDDQDSASINVPASVDLQVSKTVSSSTPNYLSNIDYTLTVSNVSPHDAATGVTVLDTLPAGLSYVASSGDGVYDAGTGLWTVGTLASGGGSATLTITAQVVATGSFSNLTQVQTCNEEDIDSTPGNGYMSEDDDAYADINVPEAADLELSKRSNKSTAQLGDTIQFSIVLDNKGPDDADNVKVRDQLPSAFELISCNGPGAYDSDTGVWTIGQLAVNQRVELDMTVIMRATGDLNNVAEVFTCNQYDPDSTPNNQNGNEDDWDYAYVNGPNRIDLELDKRVSDATPSYLDTIAYTLTVTNTSVYDDAGEIRVKDMLPDGLSYISSTGQGSYDPGTGEWNVGRVNKNGDKAELTLLVRVERTGTIENRAEVTYCGQEDLDSTPGNGFVGEDDEASVTINVGLASDLSISKSVDADSQYVDHAIRYTLVLHNAGPDSATGVSVKDMMPAGVVFIADSGDGFYNADSGVWNIGGLGVDRSVNLFVDAVLTTDLDEIVNTAEVLTSDNYDPDSEPDNGVEEDDLDRAVTVPVPLVDITLTKSADKDTLGLGELVRFSIAVSNTGHNDAHDVQVKDLLPAGISYFSHTSGDYSPTTGIWTVGTLKQGESDTLMITGKAARQGLHVNTAEVISTQEKDVDSTPANGENDEDDWDSASVYVSASGLGDKVWHDANGNGIEEAGETGFNGVTVKLLSAGKVLRTVQTDSSGYYFFANLNAGTYEVGIDESTLPTGMALTTANLPWTATLSAGGIRTDADFGYKKSGSSLGDEVWMDDNGDGIRQSGEIIGMAGVTISLKDKAGRELSTAVTDSLGFYTFNGLDPDDYRVEIMSATLQPGLSLTTAAYYEVSLGLDAHLDTLDFGVRMLDGNVGSIGNLIWIDTDRDGIQDADERTGIPNITVVLTDGSGNELATDVTDEDGNYNFNYLPAGDYWVDVNSHDPDMPADHYLTTDNEPHFVHLAAGQDYSKADFGYMTLDPGLAMLGDYTWHDKNWNRAQDGDENFLSWVDVELWQDEVLVKSQKTDLWGYYQFVGLEPGTYLVKAHRRGPTPPQPQALGKAAGSTLEPWQMTTVDSFTVTLKAGDAYLKADFGFAYPKENWGAGQEKIMARYQPWYTNADNDDVLRHWDYSNLGGYRDSSLLGCYESKRIDDIDYQILSAWAAGIDGFVVDWFGSKGFENQSAMLLLDRAEILNNSYEQQGFDFQIAFSYNDKAVGALDSNLTYLADSVLVHPAYWGVRDNIKLPLFIFEENLIHQHARAFRACADTILPESCFLIWNEADTTSFSLTDGIYPWVQARDGAWDALGDNWGEDYLDYTYETANRIDRGRLSFTLGAVWPGFDDRYWTSGRNRFMSRQDTAVYQYTWDKVHEYRESGLFELPMPWCLVESWNDFNRNTQIEPTVEYGYVFSQMTRDNARRFKTNSDPNTVGVTDLGLHVPKHIHQAKIAQELRPEAAAGIEGLADQAVTAFFNREHLAALSYADVAAGLAIRNLSVTVGQNGNIMITWEAAEYAEGYRVWFSEHAEDFNACSQYRPGWIDAGYVTSFELTGVDASKGLYLTVTAYNSQLGENGGEGWFENSLTGISITSINVEDEIDTAVEDGDALPTAFELKQNYPNPFNPSTTIAYALPAAKQVRLDVYDVRGRHITTLVDENQAAGSYQIEFDAGHLASGIYFCRLECGDFTQIRRMLLMK